MPFREHDVNIQPISFSPPQLAGFETTGPAPAAKAAAAKAQILADAKGGSVTDAQNPSQAVDPEQLKAAVQSVRDFVGPINTNLEFSITDDTHTVVVKVVDKTTKELIRQIPSEEMLAMAKALDSIKGLFIKQKA
jgi:flagellar protein FlaG